MKIMVVPIILAAVGYSISLVRKLRILLSLYSFQWPAYSDINAHLINDSRSDYDVRPNI